MAEELLLLVDGSNCLFRAYHAMPTLTNKGGEPTGVIYGVINTIRKLQADYQTNRFVVVFDAKGKTFRSDLYPEYKAHRPPTPDTLIVQIEPLHELIKSLGIPLLCMEGVEADDVIASLAKQAEQKNLKTLISSSDKDLAQLVNNDIHLLNSKNDLRMDLVQVEKKFNVKPGQIVDYLALIGDSVDNVPGVPLVGPKTAQKWLAEYGTLEQLIQHADQIKGRAGENLRAHLEQLALSQKLVTLKTDIVFDFDVSALKISPPKDMEKLKTLYLKWGLKRFLNDLDTPTTHRYKKNNEHLILRDTGRLNDWVATCADQAEQLVLYAITPSGVSTSQSRLVGLGLMTDKAVYLPLCTHTNISTDLLPEQALDKIKPLLEDPKLKKIGHDLKRLSHVLANHGIELNGISHDTMLESYLLQSTGLDHESLESVVEKWLGQDLKSYKDLAGKGVKRFTPNQLPLEQVAAFAIERAEAVLALNEKLLPNLGENNSLKTLYQNTELPLLHILLKMERQGVSLDVDLLGAQNQELAEKLEIIESAAEQLANEKFNLNSPKQIQTILYEKQKMEILEKTPKGQPSTSESVLQELALKHELPKLILEYRSLSKLRSTYTDKLPLQINSATQRLHTCYHQATVATGRLSSSDPNLQNIPIKTAEGRKIRLAFNAPDGSLILAADYSQIELRIMAHLSEDQSLLSAFAAGEDIHSCTAADVFKISQNEVSRSQRRAAKAINFGLIYGMSAFGLAKTLGINHYEAQKYIDMYFEHYPGVKHYMESIRVQAKNQGFVETAFHRRLYLPNIKASNSTLRQYAERAAINAPMQGTAADIIKKAMVEIDSALSNETLEVKMVMQVHDELVFEVAEKDFDQASDLIRRLMENSISLNVPLKVDIGFGKNWEEAH